MTFETTLLMINLYQCEKAFKTKERFLENHYFLYVHKGKGKFKIGNNTYTAKIGDLFFCKMGVGNTIIADTEYPFLLSGIDFQFRGNMSEIIDKIPEQLNIISDQFSVDLILHMIDEFKMGKVYTGEICNSSLNTLIYKTLKNDKIGLNNEENSSSKMLRYIEENYYKNLTYQDLTQITAYHKNSIHRILKNITGMSLREYIVSLRLKKATELLLYSNRTITEISELCGYNSSIFFSRQFKEKMGKRPSDFRRNR